MSSYQEAKRLIEDTQGARQLYDLLRSPEFEELTFGKYLSKRLPTRADKERVIQRTKAYTDLGGMKSYFDKKLSDYDHIDKGTEYLRHPLANLETIVAEFAVMLKHVTSYNTRQFITKLSRPYRCDFFYLKTQALALVEMMEAVEERGKRFMMRD